MLTPSRHCVLFLIAILLLDGSVQGEVTDEQVRFAIRRGTQFLKKTQRDDGSWTDLSIYVGGVTALCTLALLNAGEDVKSPVVQRALGNLRKLEPPDLVYTAALQTMTFCAAEPEKDAALIERNVRWLEQAQLKSGPRKGAWAYAGPGTRRGGIERIGGGDNSNTQFALLALHEAERVGVEVREETWKLALEHWLTTQKQDGSWGYTAREPSTGSMTCAGIASLIICSGKLRDGDASVTGDVVRCCGEQVDNDAVQRGLQWLGAHFSVNTNPSPVNLGQYNLLYYLYAVERVGRMSGRRFIGRHDWYRAGAESIVKLHDDLRGYWVGKGNGEDVPPVATSFALLFLSKGRRPVVMSKLRYGAGNAWDSHRSAVHHLTRRVEKSWRRDLTWQTIDSRAATVEDLLETPVLFISGPSGLELTGEQRENLRYYLNQGGFLFAEACCGGEEFDRDFRALMAELFPDSPLRLLPPDHPVWYAQSKVDPTYMRPLYGIDACCRTSVVYCPQDLSCYWELSRGGRTADYPENVQNEIEACLRIGENVVTYATGRELKNKLDRPRIAASGATEDVDRGVLYIPKLMHGGGGDDAPNALPNLLRFTRQQAQMRISVENRLVNPTDETLYEYPILFMHGRRSFRFTPTQREAMATYLERGGSLFVDAICASPEFTRSFRREMEAMFPDHKLAQIPPDHRMFTSDYHGYDLGTVTLRDPQARRDDDPLKANLRRVAPLLEGLELDGRVAVFFSPNDISCAMENSTSLECKGYLKQDAARLSTNIVLFALQQ